MAKTLIGTHNYSTTLVLANFYCHLCRSDILPTTNLEGSFATMPLTVFIPK